MKKLWLFLFALLWMSISFSQVLNDFSYPGFINNLTPENSATTSLKRGKSPNKQLMEAILVQHNIEKSRYLDSSRKLTYYDNNNSWQFTYKMIFTYDEDGYITSSKAYDRLFNPQDWTFYAITNYVYGTNHRIENLKSQLFLNFYDGSSRTQIDEKHYYYDTFGRQILITNYDSVTEIPFRSRCRYIYNSSNDVVQRIDDNWDPKTNKWRNGGNQFFTYDTFGNMTSYYSNRWDTTAKTWINDQKFLYSYDSTGNYIQGNTLYCNNLYSIWDTTYRSIFINDSCGNPIKGYGFQKDQNNLVMHLNSYTDFYYNCNGQLLQYITTEWQNNANKWMLHSKVEYSYDISGNNTLIAYSYWNPADSTWYNYKKDEYYFKSFYAPQLSINNSTKTAVELYPNPSSDKLYINGLNSKSHINFISVDGRLVRSFSTSAESCELDISTMPAGVYFVQIDLNGQILYKKFIKE